jgi:hypothetical protein
LKNIVRENDKIVAEVNMDQKNIIFRLEGGDILGYP